MKKKHINNLKCKICGAELSTGWCYTKLGRWIKTKIIKRKHWHTYAEIVCKQATGIYYPTVDKDWEKE